MIILPMGITVYIIMYIINMYCEMSYIDTLYHTVHSTMLENQSSITKRKVMV